jgi:hypothetical protein
VGYNNNLLEEVRTHPGLLTHEEPMTIDKPSQEFYLTRTGWVSGTSRMGDTVVGKDVERPIATVETWVEEMVIAYPQCADVYAWSLIWFDRAVSLAERKTLRGRFPKPSDGFPG